MRLNACVNEMALFGPYAAFIKGCFFNLYEKAYAAQQRPPWFNASTAAHRTPGLHLRASYGQEIEVAECFLLLSSIVMARISWRQPICEKHASKARWVYHVPIIQKNNNGVQYRKPTRKNTNCCMLHRHVIFTSCWLGLQ